MELSREQQIVFDKYIKGENIFITGAGGCGKTEIIRKIYQHATKSMRNIRVTALTGCAAIILNCKATTLHFWGGIGLGNSEIHDIIRKIKKNSDKINSWRNTEILVVDEVSMLSLKIFDLLNEIGKAIRRNDKPFGGIQVIFSGDFYQLPPVGNKDEPDTRKFCFESNEWNSVFHRQNQIMLVKNFRQKDEMYVTILNQIREGKIKRRTNDLLLSYVGRPYDENLIIEPTKLFPTKSKVEYINHTKISKLTGDYTTFQLKYLKDLEITSQEDKKLRFTFSEMDIQVELDYLVNNLICDKEINLKIGAQVMCVVNIMGVDEIYICNGSQGIVVGYNSADGYPPTIKYPVVRFYNGIERTMVPNVWISEKIPGIGVSQVPLILAWALTIHKSQGATLDAAEIDVGSSIFENGQTYVALSRVKNLDGLYLSSFDYKKITINNKVKMFYDELTLYRDQQEINKEEYIPLVIAEAIPVAIPIHGTSTDENIFIQYSYDCADVS